MMSFTTIRFDHTPERLALAEKAIEAAFRLRPDAGEAHLARAEHLYRGYLDYDGAAVGELEIARQTLPNDARLFELKGYIERRRPGGNQEEALRNLERCDRSRPAQFFLLQQIALSYDFLSPLSPTKKPSLDRVLAIRPTSTRWRKVR